MNLQLKGKTQKPIEAIESDMTNMLDVCGPSDLHGVMDGGDNIVGTVHTASHHRFPQRRQQNRHRRGRVLVLLGGSPPLPSTASANAGDHDLPRHPYLLRQRNERHTLYLCLSGCTSGERFLLFFVCACVYWEVGMETDLKFEDEFGNASFVALH